MLKTCFVIQRFDSGVYDKRYRETFAPAIERGGAKPIRADEVLGTRPIVEKIEESVRSADIAFAEISENNPNVFLELGFALALSVPTVIVCDKAKRQYLSFDIAHRPVSFYVTDAQSDYEKVAREVEVAVSAALLEVPVTSSQAAITPSNGIDIDDVKGPYLIALLDQSLRSPTGSTVWEIQKEVSSAGISDRMAVLALASLVEDGLVDRIELTDRNGDRYNSYSLSDSGTKYLLRSYSVLVQQERDRILRISNAPKRGNFADDLDDDVPF